VSIFAAALSPLAQYITHNYITPEFFVKVKDYSVTNKLMTVNAVNDYYNINNYMMQAALSSLLGGTLISAIVAIFMRRKTN
jgi:hypothetical protein